MSYTNDFISTITVDQVSRQLSDNLSREAVERMLGLYNSALTPTAQDAALIAGVTTVSEIHSVPSATTAVSGQVLTADGTGFYNWATPTGGGGVATLSTSITYSALKTLRDNGELVPGMVYRITDYVTKVTGYYDLTSIGAQGYLHWGDSAEHPFDLLVIADSTTQLNENARAIQHSGDTYFANSNLSAWEIKYCLDNDSTKYSWADTSTGKGVIWWMKDEWNNQCGYDFKNLRFVRYALKVTDDVQPGDHTPTDTGLAYNASTQPNRYGNWLMVFAALNIYMQAQQYVNPYSLVDIKSPSAGQKPYWDYDFYVSGNILGTIQYPQIDSTYKSAFNADLYYTFDYYDDIDEHADISKFNRGKCKNNYIAQEVDAYHALMKNKINVVGIGAICWEYNTIYYTSVGSLPYLQNNRINGDWSWGTTFGNQCYGIAAGKWFNNNTFGDHCNSNTFGDNCNSNTFGDTCYSNTFGDNCNSNTFGDTCYFNTFGNYCSSNTFGDNCNSNTFGDSCHANTFGNSCDANTFGDSCDANTFGDNCYSNTFGDSCYSNTFGDHCNSNTFGDNCNSNTFGDTCYSNTFGDNCNSNTFGDTCYFNTFGNYCSSNTFGDTCYSNTFGDNCNSNTFGNYCYSNTFGDNCNSNTFGDTCYFNTFGNYCYSNTFGNSCDANTFGYNCNHNTYGSSDGLNELVGYIRYINSGDNVSYVTIDSLGTNVYLNGLTISQFVSGVTVPTSQVSTSGFYTLENYSSTTTYPGYDGPATLIHKTGYNTETAVATTDGGTTWTAVPTMQPANGQNF